MLNGAVYWGDEGEELSNSPDSLSVVDLPRVFIPSKGRSALRKTGTAYLLSQSLLSFTIVVENEEFEGYRTQLRALLDDLPPAQFTLRQSVDLGCATNVLGAASIKCASPASRVVALCARALSASNSILSLFPNVASELDELLLLAYRESGEEEKGSERSNGGVIMESCSSLESKELVVALEVHVTNGVIDTEILNGDVEGVSEGMETIVGGKRAAASSIAQSRTSSGDRLLNGSLLGCRMELLRITFCGKGHDQHTDIPSFGGVVLSSSSVFLSRSNAVVDLLFSTAIAVLPQSNQGVSFARNFILRHVRALYDDDEDSHNEYSSKAGCLINHDDATLQNVCAETESVSACKNVIELKGGTRETTLGAPSSLDSLRPIDNPTDQTLPVVFNSLQQQSAAPTHHRCPSYFWIMDDDIRRFSRTVEYSKSIALSAREVFLEVLQRSVLLPPQTVIFSLEYDFFAWQYGAPDHQGADPLDNVAFNSYNNIAVMFHAPRLFEGLSYDRATENVWYQWKQDAAFKELVARLTPHSEYPQYRFRIREDYDFTLQVILRGGLTARFRYLSYRVPRMSQAPGGMTPYYMEQAFKDIHQQNLVFTSMWPNVSLEVLKNSVDSTKRLDVRVQWTKLNPLRTANVLEPLWSRVPVPNPDWSSIVEEIRKMVPSFQAGRQKTGSKKRLISDILLDSPTTSSPATVTGPRASSHRVPIPPKGPKESSTPGWKGWKSCAWRRVTRDMELEAGLIPILTRSFLECGSVVLGVPVWESMNPSILVGNVLEIRPRNTTTDDNSRMTAAVKCSKNDKGRRKMGKDGTPTAANEDHRNSELPSPCTLGLPLLAPPLISNGTAQSDELERRHAEQSSVRVEQNTAAFTVPVLPEPGSKKLNGELSVLDPGSAEGQIGAPPPELVESSSSLQHHCRDNEQKDLVTNYHRKEEGVVTVTDYTVSFAPFVPGLGVLELSVVYRLPPLLDAVLRGSGGGDDCAVVPSSVRAQRRRIEQALQMNGVCSSSDNPPSFEGTVSRAETTTTRDQPLQGAPASELNAMIQRLDDCLNRPDITMEDDE